MSDPRQQWLTDDDGLATRLQAIRRHAGLTGAQLAETNGWPPSKVSKIENGRQMPTATDVRAWAETCGSEDTDELLALLDDLNARHKAWRRGEDTPATDDEPASTEPAPQPRARQLEPPMAPQPYPLWCAVVNAPDGFVEVGLVVGWLPTDAMTSRHYAPVLAEHDEYGQCGVVKQASVSTEEGWFFASGQAEAVERACRWLSRGRPGGAESLMGVDGAGRIVEVSRLEWERRWGVWPASR